MVDQTKIHKMASSEDVEERREAIVQLRENFGNLPDKKKAWDDLIKLTSDTDRNVRRGATYALGSSFSNMHDKILAWDDLHRLSSNTHREVREVAAYAIGNAFLHVPDKIQASNDLHQLTSDNGRKVRKGAAYVFGNIFSHVPDKIQAWDDLHKLTSDTESWVRTGAADALGSAFAHMPDKIQAWNDLHRLTSDHDNSVRVAVNHSSGKVCIFRASEAENNDNFRKEMENALHFFEKASHEAIRPSLNPAEFCLPFYRSFYTLIFKPEEAVAEIERCLKEAKNFVEGSESKEKLLEAVENLANALKEANKVRDFSDVKADLNAYRHYCDRACELLDTTEDKAPGASRLIRKGLPIIDRTIKELLSELKTKSKEVCIETKDKPQNKIAAEIYSEIKKLDADNPVKFDYYIDILIESLKMKIPNVKGNEHIIQNIEAIRLLSDSDYKSLISKLIPIIGAIPQVVIGRDQINIEKFKGSLITGNLMDSIAER